MAHEYDEKARAMGFGDTYIAPEHGWTCFHCGETFTRTKEAREHFGELPTATPVCKFTETQLREYRLMERYIPLLVKACKYMLGREKLKILVAGSPSEKHTAIIEGIDKMLRDIPFEGGE